MTSKRSPSQQALTFRAHVNSQKEEFVIGNDDEWNANNRDLAIRSISRGQLELTPDVKQRLTPNDVQRLGYVLSRSGTISPMISLWLSSRFVSIP